MNPRTAIISIGSLAVLGAAAPICWNLGSREVGAALEAPRRIEAPSSSVPALEIEASAAAAASGPSSRSASEPAGTLPTAAAFEEKYRYADRDALEGFQAGVQAQAQKLGMQIMSARMRAGLSTHYKGKPGGPNNISEFALEDARFWHPGAEPRMANMMVASKGHATFEAVSLVVGDYPEFDPLQAELDWLDKRISESGKAAGGGR